MKTPKNKDQNKIDIFLDELAFSGSIKKAADKAKISPKVLWNIRQEDETFALSMDEALAKAWDMLESEALNRALEGIQEPLFYGGELVGEKTKHSDILLLALLKAKFPEKYGGRKSVDIDIGEALNASIEKLKNSGE